MTLSMIRGPGQASAAAWQVFEAPGAAGTVDQPIALAEQLTPIQPPVVMGLAGLRQHPGLLIPPHRPTPATLGPPARSP